MCGGGGAKDSPLAQQAATQEQQRQDQIKEGMRQIEMMFSGGKRATGQVGADATYDPNQTYYDKYGNKLSLQDAASYRAAHPESASAVAAQQVTAPGATQVNGGTPLAGGGGASSGAGGDYATGGNFGIGNFAEGIIAAGTDPAQFYSTPAGREWAKAYGVNVQAPEMQPVMQQARALESDRASAEAERMRRVDEQTMQEQLAAFQQQGAYTGVEDVGGYNDTFYDKAYKAQLDYALPQVDKQFTQAQRDLTYALARQGQGQSSIGTGLETALGGQRTLAIQGEQDKARQVRNQQVASVEAERDNLTKLLQSTGDVASTMNAAAARKQVLEAAPAIQEVAPLFQNATGTLADMFVNPALRAAGASNVSAGYGSSAKGSGKVVT